MPHAHEITRSVYILDATESQTYQPYIQQALADQADWKAVFCTSEAYALEEVPFIKTAYQALIIGLGSDVKTRSGYSGKHFIDETQNLALPRAIIAPDKPKIGMIRSDDDLFLPGLYERTLIPERLQAWLGIVAMSR